MNWVNSSLQLAGSLLESVDQQAALTLSATASDDESEEGEGLLSSLKKGITIATESVRAESYSDGHMLEPETIDNGDSPSDVALGDRIGDGVVVVKSPPSQGASSTHGTGIDQIQESLSTPPGSGSASRATRQTPPHSGSGHANREATTGLPFDPEEGKLLRKEIGRLKSELRAKDKQLSASHQSVSVYEEEIDALERECKEKLAEAHAQIQQLRVDKDSDEKNFVQTLELKDSQLQTLKQELIVLKQADSRYATEVEKLQQEIARSEESKDTLWTNATSATQESQQVVDAVRMELQEALTTLNNVKREASDAKAAMYARQAQLERTNAELSNSVARLERELNSAREFGASAAQRPLAGSSLASAESSGLTQLQEDHRRVQQVLMVTKKTLHDETRKNEIQRQEVLSLSDDVKRLKSALANAQDEASKRIIKLTQTNEELQVSMRQSASAYGSSASAESEARIQALTNRLMEKQETIDALRSRVTTFEVRLSDAQVRCKDAEEKLTQMESHGDLSIPLYMDRGTTVGRKSGLRNRMSSAISRVAPMMERSTRVVTAVDAMDRWLLFLGRVFLGSPLARLVLLLYVVLIHCWVFVVLSFHTSHLDEEVHGPATGHGNVDHALFPDGMQAPP